MGLTYRPKNEPRTKSLTMRVSERAFQQLKTITEHFNLSQADVFEDLVQEASDRIEKRLLKASEGGGSDHPRKKPK